MCPITIYHKRTLGPPLILGTRRSLVLTRWQEPTSPNNRFLIFSTGQIHSQHLQGQESTDNISLDRTLRTPETTMTQTPHTLLSTDIDTNNNTQCAHIMANDRTWQKFPILKKREMDVKKDRKRQSPTYPLNVQLAVKQTTEQNSVRKAQVRIYVPRGTDQEKTIRQTQRRRIP